MMQGGGRGRTLHLFMGIVQRHLVKGTDMGNIKNLSLYCGRARTTALPAGFSYFWPAPCGLAVERSGSQLASPSRVSPSLCPFLPRGLYPQSLGFTLGLSRTSSSKSIRGRNIYGKGIKIHIPEEAMGGMELKVTPKLLPCPHTPKPTKCACLGPAPRSYPLCLQSLPQVHMLLLS